MGQVRQVGHGIFVSTALIILLYTHMGVDYIDMKRDTEVNHVLIHNASLTLCLQLKSGTSCSTE